VLDDLHIHQLVRGDAAQSAWGVHCKAALLVHQVDVQRLFELQGKVIIAHRLEHIVQRVHRIPLDGVLGHIGDKNDKGSILMISLLIIFGIILLISGIKSLKNKKF